MNRFSHVALMTLTVLGPCIFTPSLAVAQSVTWNQRAVTGPSAREGMGMVYDSDRGVTVLFGGEGSGTYSGETWEWNGTSWTLRSGTGGPSARNAHAMAYDSVRHVTVLFGGKSPAGTNGETWEWNGASWTQRVVSGPSLRYFHSMAFDSARGVTVLFGGYNGGTLGDTWEWNGTTWTQRNVGGPSARYEHRMAYDAARGVTVLSGGNNGGGEAWEWNGTTWTQRSISGPLSVRESSAMAYDTARGVNVLFGGTDGNTYSNRTWEWNGTGLGTWTQQIVSGPSARVAHAMAFDSARGVTVLFGGTDLTANGFVFKGDTWEMCSKPVVTAQTIAQNITPGNLAGFTVVATGSGPISYQWRKNSVNIANSPNHILGANAATLVIVNSTAADNAIYDCVITNGCGNATSNAASLNVAAACPADFNGDGAIDFFDYLDFVDSFSIGC